MMSKRILVVDDDRAMVATLCDILELRGWETVRAYDGAEASALAEAHAVDVVLMDVRMPKVDGVSALRDIKTRRPGTRVVLMTAYAAQELLARAEAEGALQILRKPVELTDLFALLDEAAKEARTVLVVDDDPAYLTTLADLLADHGLVPTKARSLPEALALLEQDAPGAVILDLKLPGVEQSAGILAIRRVSPSVLLVLYSGHSAALAETVQSSAANLIDAAFMKPIPVPELLDVLDGHGTR
ncbi:MAG TPA: response regulator [Gemmatimonadaceae bacterium]|nr:response regulator [Gemmatimonadaceae bacterium]